MGGDGSHTTPHDGEATEMVKAVTMSMEHRYWIRRASSMCIQFHILSPHPV